MPAEKTPITSPARNRPAGGAGRLLLLVPTTSYRTKDFLEAAGRLGVELVLGSDERHVLEEAACGATLEVDLADGARGAGQIAAAARTRPFDYVVGVDDRSNAVAARAAKALGLPHNDPDAIETARNKHRFRLCLEAAGLPGPEFRLVPVGGDLARVAREIGYPCVVKPLTLNMSRGVIRADGGNSFVAACHRAADIIARDDADTPGEAADHLLVESYIEGDEYALEGLIDKGKLATLAIFDKPEPMEGPFFEESIYVAPADISGARRAAIAAGAQNAVSALGLTDGPTHIDLRVNRDGVFVIEVDARSIGGYCGRSLRFAAGLRLEDIILRHATGRPVAAPEQADGAGGVMMIPIPRNGILRGTAGRDRAASVEGVSEVAITIPRDQPVTMLPEGGRYLGFIIAHGESREGVIAALKAAHAHLEFDIAGDELAHGEDASAPAA